MENLSNDHKDFPDQHKNSPKQCNEMSHGTANMMESQWDNHMIGIPNGEKAIVEQMLASK